MITIPQFLAFLFFSTMLFFLSVEISRKGITPSKAFLFSPIYIGWLFWACMLVLTIFQSTIKNIFT